jgi:hypothetical protein
LQGKSTVAWTKSHRRGRFFSNMHHALWLNWVTRPGRIDNVQKTQWERHHGRWARFWRLGTLGKTTRS